MKKVASRTALQAYEGMYRAFFKGCSSSREWTICDGEGDIEKAHGQLVPTLVVYRCLRTPLIEQAFQVLRTVK
jgi:hypothetical protein